MTDLLTDLRDDHPYCHRCRDAAAEIERLRQQLWLAREDMAHLVQQIDVVLGNEQERRPDTGCFMTDDEIAASKSKIGAPR